ncbi:MAG: hypothetical protein ACTSPY_17315 [Candidatus Helarchaeota archaeon]
MTKPLDEKIINSKSIAFVSIMSALGTLLALISVYLVPIVGNQVALDLSHIGTYIVALSGGPLLGLITGAIVGFLPSYRFANPAIIPGKMMTGLFVGLIFGLFQKIEKIKKNQFLTTIVLVVSGLLGYIPEFIFTWWDMTYIVGLDFNTIVLPTLIKAWIEIVLITLLMAIIFSIPYIKTLLNRLVGTEIKLTIYDYFLTAIITVPIFSITLYIASLNTLIPIDPWNLKPEVFSLILWISIGIEIGLITIVCFYYIYNRLKEKG